MMRTVLFSGLTLAIFAPACPANLVIRDNANGQFEWKLSVDTHSGSPRYGTFLDIRVSAENQAGTESSTTLSNWFSANLADDEPATRGIVADSKVHVAWGPPVGYDWFGQTQYSYALRDYSLDEQVGPGDDRPLQGPRDHARDQAPHALEATHGTAGADRAPGSAAERLTKPPS